MKQIQSNVLILVLVLCGVLLLTAGIASAGGYGLSSPETTPIPETTVEDPETGDEYTIDSFAVVDPGDSLVVDVTAPSDDFDRVELRNSDDQVEAIEDSESPLEFDISSETPPGSYSLLLWAESDRQAILPVIVSGYQVTTSHEDVAENDAVEIDVAVEPAALDEEPAGAEVVVWNDETVERASASLEQTGDGTFTDTVSVGTLDEGSYSVYAIVQGEEQFQGEDEILAISGESTLSVGTTSDAGDDDDAEDDGTADTDMGDGETDDSGASTDDTVETDDSVPGFGILAMLGVTLILAILAGIRKQDI